MSDEDEDNEEHEVNKEDEANVEDKDTKEDDVNDLDEVNDILDEWFAGEGADETGMVYIIIIYYILFNLSILYVPFI